MAKFNGDDFLFEMELDTDLHRVLDSGNRRRCLNHYTTIDSLFKIICDKTLKLNNIKNLNDKLESSIISEKNLDDLVFVSSFSHTQESIPLWHMYTEPKYGVNIKFNFSTSKRNIIESLYDSNRSIYGIKTNPYEKKEYFKLFQRKIPADSSKWKVQFICSDVLYDDSIEKYPLAYPVGTKEKIALTSMGVVKKTAWEYENETRIIGYFRIPDGSYVEMQNLDFILIPITFQNLDSISITFSPWMSEEIKDAIQNFINDKLTECRVEWGDSIFTGVIERKF